MFAGNRTCVAPRLGAPTWVDRERRTRRVDSVHPREHTLHPSRSTLSRSMCGWTCGGIWLGGSIRLFDPYAGSPCVTATATATAALTATTSTLRAGR